MPWAADQLPTRRPRRPSLAPLTLLLGALLLAACFGGSEAGETEMLAGPEETGPGDTGETDGENPGTDEQTTSSDEQATSSDEQTTGSDEQATGGDEQALLEIISQAEGSEANPDNRTGAPSAVPIVVCHNQSTTDFTITRPSLPTPWGRDLKYLVCIGDMDLMRITVTGPSGDLHQQLWSDVLFGIDFSVLDEPGTYEIVGQRRQGDDVVTVFEHPPLEHLHIAAERDEPGVVRLELAGYGDERALALAVYGRSEEPGALATALAYRGSLAEIPLEEDGTTVARLTTDEDFLCFYVDAAYDDRFPTYQYGCMKPAPVPYEPGDLDLAVRLTEALDESGRQAISPVVANIDDDRAVAIATVIDVDTGQPAGAALFEGTSVGGGDILDSIQLRERDTNADFKAAFSRLCTVAAETHVVIGNPCLRTVVVPGEVILEGFEPIQIDDQPLIEIIDQAAITDCLPYDPDAVTIIDEGADGFLLTDGTSRMAVLDTKADAEIASAVARYHDRQCFVGRDNQRADRDAYVAEFWLGGRPGGPELADEDCVRYDPTRLEIVDAGEQGWGLNAGGFRLLVLDTKTDAQEALNTAAGFTRQCFAGRDNQRATRSLYLFQYWR